MSTSASTTATTSTTTDQPTAPTGATPTASPGAPAAAPAKVHGFDTVALVLQGGGALGAYQAGVAECLHTHGIEPDWVAGISIGAINSALIAGNPPERRIEKLRGFWETICQPTAPWLSADTLRAWVEQQTGDVARLAFSGFEAWRAVVEGKPGFFTPRGVQPWLGLPGSAGQASFYDTSALKATLERFADFDRINHGPMRLSVGAVDVHSGNFVYFDNREGKTKGSLRAEHILASGALPPGFPAIEVDGAWYWDGGLVSNTPLWQVLEGRQAHNTLVFQVDLWSATGPLPANVYDAQERMKDIQFSSRTRAVTDSMDRQQKNRQLLQQLLALIPPEVQRGNPWCEQAQAKLGGGQTSVVQLIYRDKRWEGLAKDYEFSRPTMLQHWASGIEDARRALAHPDWLRPDAQGRAFVSLDDGRPAPG